MYMHALYRPDEIKFLSYKSTVFLLPHKVISRMFLPGLKSDHNRLTQTKECFKEVYIVQLCKNTGEGEGGATKVYSQDKSFFGRIS